MTRGKFITLEGGEGLGKTTNSRFIENYLSSRGINLVTTREPGGTEVGEAIRQLLVGAYPVLPETELLLVFAARTQHVKEVIRPALDRGHWVVCDRFTDASYAYQGAGRGIAVEVIAFLENWVHGELQPDLTLLFDAPVELGLERAKGRGGIDRFETESLEFFQRVRTAYRERSVKFAERIQVIDASQPLTVVQAHIAQYLSRLIGG